ncbi:hypothetical protein HXX76_011401 [Chlamydomonas incerta]|uniref:Uncharacterized protein n=1 Tax=Chlamydomonas incerta TaxID=51695 RepID=A0A835VXH8_CHLIN|nr:hypothetical protein HXX76_011401 [Chlamydomonas incerta]|eukprot:KAG2428696.1 hypothetical protein HXX76_011401 [Chlamydomonas incerta]
MASGQNATASAPPPRPPPPPLLVVRRPPPPSPPPPSPPQPPPPVAQDNSSTNRIIIIGTAAIAIGGTLIICCLAVLLIYLLRSQTRKRKEKRQKARRASYLADVEAGPPGGGDKGGPGGARGGAHDKLRSPMLSGVGDIPSRPTSIDGRGAISPVNSMRQRDIAPDAADAIRAAMLAVFDGGDGGGAGDGGVGRRHASATDVGDGLQRSDSWAQPVAPRMASHVDAAGPRGGGAAAAAAAMRFSGAGTAAAASGNSSRWRMSRFGRNAGAGGPTASGLAGHDSPLARSRSKTASGLITSDRPSEAVLKPSASVPQGSALLRSTLEEHAGSPGGSSGPNTPPWVRGRRRVEVITGHDEDDELVVMEPGEAGDEEEDADTLGLGPFTQDGEVVSFSKGGGAPLSAGAMALPLAGSSDSGKGAETAAGGAEGKGGKGGKEGKEEGKEKKKKGFLGFKSKKKKEEPSMVSNPTYKPAYMMPTAAMAAKSGLDLTKEADKYEKRPSRFGTATPPPGSPAVGGRLTAPGISPALGSPANSRADSPARKAAATHGGYAHVSTFGPGGPSYTGAAAAQGAKLRRLHGSADATAPSGPRRNTLAGLMASAGSGTEGGGRRMTAPGSAAGSRHNLGEHIGPMGSASSVADLKALEKTLPGSPRRASLVIPDSAFAAMVAQHGLKDGDDPAGV